MFVQLCPIDPISSSTIGISRYSANSATTPLTTMAPNDGRRLPRRNGIPPANPAVVDERMAALTGDEGKRHAKRPPEQALRESRRRPPVWARDMAPS
ncbi:hypothetical protein DM77_3316 [Burkholderia mallei]|nr:hypothetical protein DM77_3316 [Burkholderia mallei]